MKKVEVVKGAKVRCVAREENDVPQIGDIGIILEVNTGAPLINWSGKEWAMTVDELEVV